MNRLQNTNSPYLLQHAKNPVDWQPWDEQALQQAKKEDKPILLSIGYFSCHWCHVMEAESFASPETAQIMNRHFINIKVDREERPDLDKIYQSAYSLFTRQGGGWPLTMFLTEDKVPFFGGTYFPPVSRGNLPSFTDVLQRIVTVWTEKRPTIYQQSAQVLPLLQSLDQQTTTDTPPQMACLQTAREHLKENIDRDNGGLGTAPKFPHPVELHFCLSESYRHQDKDLQQLIHSSLKKIACSGLADQLAGGFFRYCVDEKWTLPHFEKMLYDNALLLTLYADAAVAFDDEGLRAVVYQTIDWLQSQMKEPTATGFYAAVDADNVDGEGRYYLWTMIEINTLLSESEKKDFFADYQLQLYDEDIGHLLLKSLPPSSLAKAAGEKLKQQRQSRLPPAYDDKILTAWNALMIKGLARSSRHFMQEEWGQLATDAFFNLWQKCRIDNQTLAGYRENQNLTLGFLDDCVFLLDAALELLRWRFSADLLNCAIALADELILHYADSEEGGFFFTSKDSTPLIRRLKTADDGVTPNSNGLAAQNLLLLYRLDGNPQWHHHATKTLSAFSDIMQSHPQQACSLLSALKDYHHPPKIVFLVGQDCKQWQQQLEKRYTTDILVYCLPQENSDLPASLQKPTPPTGETFATVCDESSCAPPVNDLSVLMQNLSL